MQLFPCASESRVISPRVLVGRERISHPQEREATVPASLSLPALELTEEGSETTTDGSLETSGTSTGEGKAPDRVSLTT